MTGDVHTAFDRLLDLKRLPWFDAVGGRLVLDPAIGPVIDLHSHLALSFLRRPTVELAARTAVTSTYLPADHRFDLDVYANRNFDDGDLAALGHDLTVDSLGPGGLRATHTIPNLVRDMRPLNIVTSVLHAIDWPWGLSSNAETWLRATAGRSDLIVFGSVHPWDRDVPAVLDEQLRLGARGIKVHPAVQLVAPSARRCRRLYAECGDRGLPIFFHCGPVDIEPRLGRRLSQVRGYVAAIDAHPETTFVLGHSGALQLPEAIALAATRPNVWLELASQSLSGVRRILAEAPVDRVVYGSDWPFYPQAIGIAKVLLATTSPTVRAAVLHDNACRLLDLGSVGSISTGGS